MTLSQTYHIEDILENLSSSQKISLLSGSDFWHTTPVPGVPKMRMSDGPNGVRGTKFFNSVPSACFPCGTALGSTMDKELMYEAGELMAKEAKAKGVHVILGPTVNMQRSPLGGRGYESYSEDPVLSGTIASHVIKGMQSKGIQATLKHFVGNDQEDERLAVDAQIPQRALREIYLKPFQIAIKESNPGMIMSCYNKVNGLHVADSRELIGGILREEWGWNGMITSDWFGTYSTSLGVHAGVDLEMPGPSIWRGYNLESALRTRDVSINDIDDRARGVIQVVTKAMNESGVPEDAHEGQNNNPDVSKFLRQLAAESIVLLKNEDDTLPLSKELSTAVIGPNGKVASISGGGSAALNPYYKVTPYEGIAAKTKTEPKYTIGVDTSVTLPLLGEKLETEVGQKGFIFKTYDAPQEDSQRKLVDTLHLTDSNMFMADYMPDVPKGKPYYVDVTGYFIPEEDGIYEFGVCVRGTGRLYIDGELVVDNGTTQRPGSSFMGTGTVEEIGSIELKQGKRYKVTVKFGSGETSKLKAGNTVVFGGALRLGMRKKMDVETEIEKAVNVAKSVDQVVLCLGLNSDYESEGFDRQNMDLPPHIDELVNAVTQVNRNTVVVMQSGTPVTLPWIDKVKGYIQAWYGGNETGNAIADVLFGDVNPSGKLSLTFPKRCEDNPAFLNFRSENGVTVYGENVYIGYRYYEAVKRDVLFPFGFGLSYTRFSYRNLEAHLEGEGLDQKLIVSVDISNVGDVEGKESVQVYISQHNPSIGRPPKELKGFEKVRLAPGESQSVKVKIDSKYAFSYWDDSRGKWVMEKDKYEVHVASSSEDIKSTATVDVTATKWWVGL